MKYSARVHFAFATILISQRHSDITSIETFVIDFLQLINPPSNTDTFSNPIQTQLNHDDDVKQSPLRTPYDAYANPKSKPSKPYSYASRK